ncbi:DUF2393 family protein [Edaphobacter paludis]|uniref:DUF2393 family protein n=1 Tax=Edaphobacter paludis TaxID=3035702 RepID=A0AAU7CWT7_9BACT
MSDLNQPEKTPAARAGADEPAMFGTKPPAGAGIPMVAWAVAALVVVLVVVGMIMAGRGKGRATPTNSVQRLAPYAGSLPLSQLAMSESTSISGGKSTFVDGHIKNTGTATVTGITVQVLFGNLEGSAPTIDTLPLTLIRTRQPYIDTQSVASSPLKPGDEREFRLIFESIPQNWNMEMPEVRVVGVETK